MSDPSTTTLPRTGAPATVDPRRGAALLAALSLTRREIVRFLRQRSRVVGGLATPIVFWVLIGSGLGRSFVPPGTTDGGGFLSYAFAGTVALILLFTAIFSTISIIEDRREGFLQSVLVAPIPRVTIVAGKVLGGTLLAVGQALVFVLIAPLVGFPLGVVKLVTVAAVLLVVGAGLTGLGFLIAWAMDSTQGFHAIMNLLLIPMWLLSGALFPASGAPAWLRWVMAANPLTYGVALIRRSLVGDAAVNNNVPGWGVSVVVWTAFTAAMIVACTLITSWRRAEKLRTPHA